MLTRWLVFHVASGQSFFTGAGCLVVAVCVSAFGTWRQRRVVRNLLVFLGESLVFASATPLPPWCYFLLTVATLLWLAVEASRWRDRARLVAVLRAAVVIAWLAGISVELPYHVLPSVPPLGRPILGIIGDSVTAGTGRQGIVTWPGILADRHGVMVRDHSQMGANVAYALKQAASVSSDERFVLLEIGGNDVLGETTPEGFESGLARLLSALHRPGRVVVMLELPLPPTYNAYGRIQRRLARRYRTLLVPRRVLLGVLQQDGATVDTIHLTQDGHRRMAAAMWDVVKNAYTEKKGAPDLPTIRSSGPANRMMICRAPSHTIPGYLDSLPFKSCGGPRSPAWNRRNRRSRSARASLNLPEIVRTGRGLTWRAVRQRLTEEAEPGWRGWPSRRLPARGATPQFRAGPDIRRARPQQADEHAPKPGHEQQRLDDRAGAHLEPRGPAGDPYLERDVGRAPAGD